MPAQTVIKLRRDSAADWASVNPVLAEGEVGLETDTGLVKYGNGTSAWTALSYPSNSNTTYLVRNNTGSTIPKGTLVSATGAEPSGRIDVAPFEVTGLQDSELRVMGIATANIANGVNGTVMSFGTLTGLDTRGSTASALAVGDETWAAGDILYAHPTADGKLTKVRPKHDLAIAFITIRNATAGQISVRIVPGNFHLEWLHDVVLDSPAEGQVLQYDGTDWVNADIVALPDQTGNTGKYLKTDGTDASWSDVVTEVTAAIVDSAPATLDTLNELAAALGDDPNFATTVTAALGEKAPINSPTFTGTVAGVTKAHVGLGNVDNTTDAGKPVSTATQTALNAKANTSHTHAMGDLTDFSITGPATGQVLRYDGTDWVNSANINISASGPVVGRFGSTVVNFNSTLELTGSVNGGALFRCTAADATIVRLFGSAYGWAIGDRIDFVQAGAGRIAFLSDDQIVVSAVPSPPATRRQFSGATAIRVTNNTWHIIGDLAVF